MYVIYCFPLVTLNIFSLIFGSLINMCLSIFFLGFLSVLPGLNCFLVHVREIFSCNLLKYFLRLFLSFSLFHLRSLSCDGGALNVVPEVSETVLISFSLFCSMAVIYTTLSSGSFICSSASFIPLLIPSSVFFISVIIHLLFSKSSSSLLTIFCITLCLHFPSPLPRP